MTIRELLDTCALDFNKIEILQGLKVKRWEQYKSEWGYEYKYNIEIYAE